MTPNTHKLNQENIGPNSLMNIDAKLLNNIIEN